MRYVSIALALAGVLVAGIAAGRLLARVVDAEAVSLVFTSPGLPWLALSSLLAMLLVVLVHELGHVAGGRLAGYSFLMLVVGPFKWVRERGGVRWRLNTSLNAFGGLALMVPPGGRADARLMARYILGGPAASLILFAGCVLGIVLLHVMRQEIPLAGEFALFLLVVAVMTLGAVVVTALPLHSGGWASDGGQFLDVARGGHRAERRLLMLAIAARSFNGARPREWGETRVARLLELAEEVSDQLTVAAYHTAFYHFLDAGRPGDAGKAIDRALALKDAYPVELQSALWLERAYFLARHRGDAVGAAAALVRGTGGHVEPHTRGRAEAAVALARGEVEAARAAIDLALSRIASSVDPGGALAERDWLLEMRAEAGSSGA